tara:strand:- start:4680 stop:4964 length:285 start_codon:yes stop_codon:yes gene_type:complete
MNCREKIKIERNEATAVALMSVEKMIIEMANNAQMLYEINEMELKGAAGKEYIERLGRRSGLNAFRQATDKNVQRLKEMFSKTLEKASDEQVSE